MTAPTLAGVGMGPGDPELVTVKAVRVLREADLVLVPVMADTGELGRAEATVRAHVTTRPDHPGGVRADRGRGHGRTGGRVGRRRGRGGGGVRRRARLVAFATIGDPNVYSTFTYLAATVGPRVPGLTVATVPGITAMQDLAARSGTVLCEGRETLALLPLTAGLVPFRRRWRISTRSSGTRAAAICPRCSPRSATRAAWTARCTGPASACPARTSGPAAEVRGPAPYLSTLLVPGRRTGRGGKL